MITNERLRLVSLCQVGLRQVKFGFVRLGYVTIGQVTLRQARLSQVTGAKYIQKFPCKVNPSQKRPSKDEPSFSSWDGSSLLDPPYVPFSNRSFLDLYLGPDAQNFRSLRLVSVLHSGILREGNDIAIWYAQRIFSVSQVRFVIVFLFTQKYDRWRSDTCQTNLSAYFMAHRRNVNNKFIHCVTIVFYVNFYICT